MGYSIHPPEFAQYEFGNYPDGGYFDVDTVGVTPLFQPISIPSWLAGKIEHAYLDAYFPYIINGPAVENELAWDTYIQVGNAAGTVWTNACLTRVNTLNLPASSTYSGLMRVIGHVDIASVVEAEAGSFINVRWDDVGANADVLRFRGVYMILRLFVKG